MRILSHINRYFKKVRKYNSRLIPFGIFLLLAVSCCGLVYKATTFYDRIYIVRSSSTDNFGWSINQLEVEMYAVSLALEQKIVKALVPASEDDNLEEYNLDLWLDIFFSRVDSISNQIRKHPEQDQFINLIPDLQRRTEELGSLIEDLDTSDLTSVSVVRLRASELQSLSREISVRALQVFIFELGQKAKEEERLFSQFFLITLILLALALATTLCVLFLWAEFVRRTKRMVVALDNQSRVFMSSPTGIVVAEMSGQIRFANPSFSAMLGGEMNDFIGRHIQEFFQDSAKIEVVGGSANSFDTFSLSDMEDSRFTALRLDGSTFCAEVSNKNIYGMDGSPTLAIMLRDVTLTLIHEDEIRAARDEAEQNAVSKSNFLATMSHEMRTPLHCATAALDLIEEETLNDDQKQLIEIAKLSSERAIAEVNMVLDVSQSENAKHDEEEFSPKKVVAGILLELEPLAKQKNNKTRLVCEGNGAEGNYRGNFRAFGRVIYNLTSNALKFTDQGDVQVTLAFSKHDARYDKLDVKIKDEGVGIAPRNRELIFEEFVTLENGDFGRESSIGLGLPIARRAVAGMGGVLELQSEIGIGSIFSFSILLARACNEFVALELAEVAPTLSRSNLNFLVVDDKELNRELLSKMVSQLDHNHAGASNGLEAVSSACHRFYDVILMDDSMPVMGGREAVRHIRAGGPSKNSLIIGVTAYSDQERLSDFADAGADLVLVKPVKKQQLVEALDYLSNRKSVSSETVPSFRHNYKTETIDAFAMFRDALGPLKAFRLLNETLLDVKAQSEYLLDDLSSLDEIADRLHSIIGTTGFAGLENLSMLLRAAEQSARNGHRDELGKHYDQISISLKQELIAVNVMLEEVKDAEADGAEEVSSKRMV
jgi:PAS domain S-box-containing protein